MNLEDALAETNFLKRELDNCKYMYTTLERSRDYYQKKFIDAQKETNAVPVDPNQKPEFISFPKIPRLFKECVITEKIDGTNGLIHITGTGDFFVGSRNRWLTEESDNHGFRQWAMENKDELMKLGVGSHHGEWWGSGIQRGYNLPKGEKRFSLFNVSVWNESNKPTCCHVVPTLYIGEFSTTAIEGVMDRLKDHGSYASSGFMNPEGVMVYHTTANQYFKVPFDKNPKGQ